MQPSAPLKSSRSQYFTNSIDRPHDYVPVHYLAPSFETWVGFVCPEKFGNRASTGVASTGVDVQPLTYKQVTMFNVRDKSGQIPKKYGQQHLLEHRYGWFKFPFPFDLDSFPKSMADFTSPIGVMPQNEFLRNKLIPQLLK